MLWVCSLLRDIVVDISDPMTLYCDNQTAIFIIDNPISHERTKHIEVDCHFLRDLLMKKHIITTYLCSDNQLGDILTKTLARVPFRSLTSKLCMFDMYAPV